MSQLSTFFKEADSATGVFYPKNHLVAVFVDSAEAGKAKLSLRDAGRLDEDVIIASGEEVVRYAEAQGLDEGLWGKLMTEVSRTIGTEAAYSDEDLAAAKAGAAFVAVLCPNEEVKVKAWKALEASHPLSARYYSVGGIEHLAGDL